MPNPLIRFIPLSLLLAGCAGTAILWRPSFVSQVPDSTTVRVVIEPGRPPTRGIALDWQRGRPRFIQGRDTIVLREGTPVEVRLPKKAGHPTAGGVIGWAIGVGLSYAFCPPPKRYCGEEDPTPLIGAVLGALIGAKIKTEEWVGVRWDNP